MAIGGIAHGLSDRNICDALEAHKGVLRAAAKSLNVSYMVIYRAMEKSPEIKTFLEHARKAWVEEQCDHAEEVVSICHSMVREEPAVALKAAMFTLNNLGGKREYKPLEAHAKMDERGLADAIVEAGRHAVTIIPQPVKQGASDTTS